ERIEEVTGALFFFSVVLLQIQEVENISMPGLEVNGKRTFAFSAALVHVTRGVIKHPQHGDDSVRRAVGSFNIGSGSPYIMDGQSYASCRLGNFGGLLQGVVNAVYAVVLHGK